MAVLGKVAVVPKGTYSSSSAYERLDIVSYEGASYIAIQDSPIGILPTNASYFQALSMKGLKGDPGTSYTYRWDGTKLIIATDGVEGEPVELAGYSPVVTITEIDGGNKITITDADGDHDFIVTNGVSPTVTTTDTGTGHTITITSVGGTSTFDVEDGISPVISATKEGKVTTITITDAGGTRTLATINDGQDGDGSGDMSMSTYDRNQDGIVDLAEGLASTATISINQVTDLSTQLEEKSPVGHTHITSDVTDLETELNDMQTDINSKSPIGHTHLIGDVDNLSATLEGKSPVGHTHEISDVNDLQDELNSIISGSGVGDMLKSVYDTDDDGVVDRAAIANVAEELSSTASVPASQIASGSFLYEMKANETATQALETAQLRNIVILSTDPGEGAEVSYPAGTLVIYA